MAALKDKADRSWVLTVDVGAIRRVKGALGVDLLDIARGDLLERLVDDPVLLVDVLFVLCKPQADEAKVTHEDFDRSIVGHALDDAASALFEEILDFFPRGLRARAFLKLRAVLTRTLTDVTEVEAVSRTGGAETPTATPGESSGSSPAPPASTPTG